VRDAFISPRTLRALAVYLPAFVLFDLADVILGVQLGAAAAYSAWATADELRWQREVQAEAYANGLEPLARDPRLAWSYCAALFATWFGFLGVACFLARALVELAGG
jgi:hypothetical protein